MKKLKFLPYFLLFLFIRCNSTLVSPDLSNSGNITLLLDKLTIPTEVVEITADLSRTGYNKLSETVNIKTDSTAEITFQKVSAGTWHLKVDANDGNGNLLYEGETDISVKSDTVSYVSLNLNPASSGFGDIQIYISWGKTVVKFIDYEYSILNRSDIYNGFIGCQQAKIINNDGKYRMFVNSIYQSHHVTIGYTESSDGITWNQPFKDAVLQLGNPGKWDDEAVEVGGILYENGNYLMYYTGSQSSDGNWNIGMATSADGIHWEKVPQPVLYADNKEFQLHVDDVVKFNNSYYLYYTIRNPYSDSFYSIGLATSSDAIHWNKCPQNPILKGTQDWEGNGVYFPSVIYNSNRFEMVYMNTYGNGFGMAYSQDGINWIKESSNPIFVTENVYNKASKISYPFYRRFEGKYRIYYTSDNNDGSKSIRMATRN